MPKCATCGGAAERRCSRCKSIYYCGTQCQEMDWKRWHYKECHYLKSPPPRAPQAEQGIA